MPPLAAGGRNHLNLPGRIDSWRLLALRELSDLHITGPPAAPFIGAPNICTESSGFNGALAKTP